MISLSRFSTDRTSQTHIRTTRALASFHSLLLLTVTSGMEGRAVAALHFAANLYGLVIGVRAIRMSRKQIWIKLFSAVEVQPRSLIAHVNEIQKQVRR